MHVFLNPDDLNLIACFLGFLDSKLLFDESIVIIDTERGGAPLPRLRFSSGAAGCCPFLENRLDEDGDSYSLSGLCRLHPDSKPLVCWLAPLHRTVDFDLDTELWGLKSPLPGCPGFGSFIVSEAGAPEPHEFLLGRLDSEKAFFKNLSAMLDAGIPGEEIVRRLYFFKTDCQR